MSTTPPPPFTDDSFPDVPELECDLVMKGGITSGVVYPLAVCELATTYRLRSLGGASAGAIAAAVAAAAELGRQEKATALPGATLPPGFAGLARFPELLTRAQPDGRSLLFHLFRPQPKARRLFDLLATGLDAAGRGSATKAKLVATLFRRTVVSAPLASLAGVAPGLAVAVLAVLGLVAGPGSVWAAVALVVALVAALLVALGGLVIAQVARLLADVAALPALGFGLTSGRGETDAQLALTPWLGARLQELAGRPLDEPLTFGDLRSHQLELKVMTTDLGRQRPLAMPWTPVTDATAVGEEYYFHPDQFRALFGDAVVDAMVTHPPAPPADPEARRRREILLAQLAPLRPFPAPDDLPVIVATRMSLSFPVLISAVPLYVVDPARAANRQWAASVEGCCTSRPDASAAEVAERVGARPVPSTTWFSDGGLTANLPVQFFDSPIPSRPTFAIDLAEFGDRPRSPDEADNSDLPDRDAGPVRRTERWPDAGLPRLLAFAVALVQTARTWVDQASLAMPGYRDRVVTVFQGADEGGLNLSMPAPVVAGLSLRGRFAARRLVARFAKGGGWTDHRWLRFRTSAAAYSDWLAAFERRYQRSFYDPLLADVDAAPSYPVLGEERLAAVRARTDALVAQAQQWAQPPADAFTAGRPQEPPVLRLQPPG